MKNHKVELGGKIERIQIPDEDVRGWMKTLEEAGLDHNEIDEIMTHLNKAWRSSKKPEIIKQRMDDILEDLKVRDNYTPSEDEKEALKELLGKDFE